MSFKTSKNYLILVYGCKVLRRNGKLTSLLFQKRWEKEFTSKRDAFEFASRNAKLYKDFHNLNEVQHTVAEFVPEPKPQVQKIRHGLRKRLYPWLNQHWQELWDNPVTQHSVKAFGKHSTQTVNVMISLLGRFCPSLKQYRDQLDKSLQEIAQDLLFKEVQEFLQQTLSQQQSDTAVNGE